MGSKVKMKKWNENKEKERRGEEGDQSGGKNKKRGEEGRGVVRKLLTNLKYSKV